MDDNDRSRRPASFKAYDIRGRVPDELDAGMAFRLGRAYAQRFGARRVAVGRDARLSSPMLRDALALGLEAAGGQAVDIGLCGTEEVYFAAQQPGIDGGIMITASHNPPDYNGMKLVRAGAIPVSGDSGLHELAEVVAASDDQPPRRDAALEQADFRPAYVEFLLSRLQGAARPLRAVVNAGNGTAGAVVDALARHLPLDLVRLQHEPDGRFPHGVPNPLLPEHRARTAKAVVDSGADLGIAWDGDFDRCFFFDENGRFIDGYYIVGLLAEAMLARHPGARIVHDPRLTWNTLDIVRAHGGEPVQSKTGHAFIKERMRREDAAYGGEMSAHHYFRDFAYCDNGMLPWLLVAECMAERRMPLSALVDERMLRFPISGEINRTVADAKAVLAAVEDRYSAQAESADHTDGISMSFGDWRFNLRASNTEPLLRLNVESRGDAALMRARTAELLAQIGGS